MSCRDTVPINAMRAVLENQDISSELLEALDLREQALLMMVCRACRDAVQLWIGDRHRRITGRSEIGSLLCQYPMNHQRPLTRWRIFDSDWGGHGSDSGPSMTSVWCPLAKKWVIRHECVENRCVNPWTYLDTPSFLRPTRIAVFGRPYRVRRLGWLRRSWIDVSLFLTGRRPRNLSEDRFLWMYADGGYEFIYFEVTLVWRPVGHDYDESTVSIGWSVDSYGHYPLLFWESEEGLVQSPFMDFQGQSVSFMGGDTVGIGYCPVDHEIFFTSNGLCIDRYLAPWSPVFTRLFPFFKTNSGQDLLVNLGASPFLFQPPQPFVKKTE